MASIKIACRSTLGGATDPAGVVAFLNDNNYPTVKNDGTNDITFGRDTGFGGMSWRDRGGAAVEELQGQVNASSATVPARLRIDLLSAGTKTISLASGDNGFSNTYNYIQILDGATPVLTISDTDGTAAGEFYDANGTLHASSAAWTAGNISVEHTFVNTTAYVVMGDGTGAGRLAYIEFVDSVGGGDPVRRVSGLSRGVGRGIGRGF